VRERLLKDGGILDQPSSGLGAGLSTNPPGAFRPPHPVFLRPWSPTGPRGFRKTHLAKSAANLPTLSTSPEPTTPQPSKATIHTRWKVRAFGLPSKVARSSENPLFALITKATAPSGKAAGNSSPQKATRENLPLQWTRRCQGSGVAVKGPARSNSLPSVPTFSWWLRP
jgi:hypothetical protein